MKIRYKVAFVAVCLATLAMFTLGLCGEAIQKLMMRDYHARMTSGAELLTLEGQKGSKFTVYDADRQQFRSDCLPEELLAQSPDEVTGVFVISLSERSVGSYSMSDAMQYYEHITLYDCYYGQDFASSSVDGEGDPPEARRFSFFDWHSKKPTADQISEVCCRMAFDLVDYYSEQSFSDKVSAAVEAGIVPNADADGFITFDADEERYTAMYIPEELVAESIEDIKGIFIYSDGGNGTRNAEIYLYEVASDSILLYYQADPDVYSYNIFDDTYDPENIYEEMLNTAYPELMEKE